MDAWKVVLGKSSVEDMSIPMAYVMAPKVCILIFISFFFLFLVFFA